MTSNDNVIPFSIGQPIAELVSFDNSDDPADFLKAVEITFRENRGLDELEKRIGHFIDSLNVVENRAKVLDKACRLLAKLEFAQPTKPTLKDELPPSPPISDNERTAARSIADALAKIVRNEEILKEVAARSPYEAFRPAYRFIELIPQIFGDADPVKVICEYMDALQPTKAFSHPNDCWFDERIQISSEYGIFYLTEVLLAFFPDQLMETPSGKWDHQLWTQSRLLVAFMLGRLTPLSEKQRAFNYELPHDQSVDQLSHEEKQKLIQAFSNGIKSFDGYLFFVLGTLLPVPQGLFVAVIRHWLDCGVLILDGDTSKDILRSLLNFPVGRPARSWEEIELGVVDSDWLAKVRELYKDPELVPFLPAALSGNSWFDCLLDTPPQCTFSWVNEESTYWRAMQAWSNKISLLRNDMCGGRFPWKAELYVSNLYNDYELSRAEWDMHLHLIALMVEESEAGSWEWEDEFYGDSLRDGFRSFNLYRNAWIAARRESYPELGNALLAFYLFRKGVYARSMSQFLTFDWRAFSEHSRIALSERGNAFVRQAIEFLKSICREKGWDVDLLRLKNILPDSGQIVSLAKISELRAVENIHTEPGRLIDQLIGPDLMSRFSKRSRKLLVEAEVRFQHITRTVGAGVTEFGPETLAFARAFENELHERIKNVYNSPELAQHWSIESPNRPLSTLPTFGSYLRVLESNLPERVVEKIENAGVFLHRCPELLRRLGQLKDKRNQGGHASHDVTGDQLFRQRVAIFDEHLLRDFLGALSPRA